MNDRLQTTRILLVDDHALFRDGLERLLDREADFCVSGKAGSAREALTLLLTREADIVLLDFDLGAERAIDFITVLRNRGFRGKVLVVTAGVSDHQSVQLVQAGVSGIFHKHNPPEQLCQCIRQITAGEVWLEPNYLKPLFRTMDESQPPEQKKLTDREAQVLRGLFQGLANKEIADRLGLSESSIKGVIQQLFHKTRARTRSQLVRVALEQYRDQL